MSNELKRQPVTSSPEQIPPDIGLVLHFEADCISLVHVSILRKLIQVAVITVSDDI